MCELNEYALKTERLLQNAVTLLKIGVDKDNYIAEMMGNFYLVAHYYITFKDERSLMYIYEMLDIAETKQDNFEIGLYHYFMGKFHYEYLEDNEARASLDLVVEYLDMQTAKPMGLI